MEKVNTHRSGWIILDFLAIFTVICCVVCLLAALVIGIFVWATAEPISFGIVIGGAACVGSGVWLYHRDAHNLKGGMWK